MITNVHPGDYCVNFTFTPVQKIMYMVSPIGQDNKFDQSGGHCFTVSPATTKNHHYRAWLGMHIPPVYIRGHAFLDENQDGSDNKVEQLLAGIEISLLDGNNHLIKTITTVPSTDRINQFRFDNLAPGNYCMKAVDPSHKYVTGPMGVSNTFNSSSLYCFTIRAKDGSWIVLPGFIPAFRVVGFAWNDENNNGAFESSEQKLTGVKGELTLKDGTHVANLADDFHVDNLKAGDYCIQMKLTPDQLAKYLIAAQGTDNHYDKDGKYCFSLTKDSPVANAPIGLYSPKISVQGHAYEDLDKNGGDNQVEPLLGGIVVTLKNADGDVLNTWTTDANAPRRGQFKAELHPGRYCMSAVDPSGKFIIGPKGISNTFDPQGNFCFTIRPTDTTWSIYPGFTPAFKITGFVWNDVDLNGNFVDTETKLDGFTAKLTTIGEFVADIAPNAANGFTSPSLIAGDYCIHFELTPEQMELYLISPIGNDNKYDKDGKYCFALNKDTTDSNHILKAPLGLTIPKINISGRAFMDSNKDGGDNNEDLIGGIVITFKDSKGEVIQTITTDVNAPDRTQFKFDITPGSYCAHAEDPSGKYIIGPKGISNTFDDQGNYCFKIRATDTPWKILPGFTRVFKINVFAWNDVDNNGNFVDTETKLAGFKGTITTVGKPVVNFTTDATNGYTTPNLLAGDYCIQFDFTQEQKDQYLVSPVGNDNKYDKDGKYCFTLDKDTADSNHLLKAPLGLNIPKINVSGRAFIDSNKDGSDNVEPMLGGAIITFKDSKGGVLQTITTDANAPDRTQYKFDLPPGRYCAHIEDPSGLYKIGPKGISNTFDDQGDYCFTLRATDTPWKILPGFVPDGFKVVGSAWSDLNNDGIKDASETTLIAGIAGSLTEKVSGNEVTKVTTTSTGDYKLRVQNSGDYCLTFSLTNDQKKAYKVSPIAANNKFDADGKYCFTVDSTTVNAKNEFPAPLGLYAPLFVIQGHAYDDLDASGGDNGGEPLLPGIDITLTKADGTPINKWTTASGTARTEQWIQRDNPVGDYCMTAVDTSGRYRIGPKGISNAFDPQGKYCFSLTTADKTQKMLVLPGFVPNFKVMGVAWSDLNKDGIKDASETTMIQGVTVTLTEKVSGNEITKVTTPSTGAYSFDLPKEGVEYCLTFMLTPEDRILYISPPVAADNKFASDGKYCFTADRTTANSNFEVKASIGLNIPLATIQGHAYEDLNKDGSDNDAEPLIGGIIVTLTKADGTQINKWTTDANAQRVKQFVEPNVIPGDYCLTATDPSGKYIIGPKGQSNKFDAQGKNCFTILKTGDPIFNAVPGFVPK
ncbi:hypothetical protein SAMD00019534_010420 [Acytostelium subglobosum LB1]|uniref:hypothetical protein n=1 Tax=Acytostelium subglobosum LB1 TaxID=1410327 RepID=UPI000644EA08|nr:hypothetical protein SAMD00019534_010420 [Acytostelium subglobosum LB1]GAM17867.1 hypothetical protein SAMD00019534_010420 [Acytostelium subglobosum LB1]|eukprot:XP_012758463.1 hypothetical protein SAMD00019534_010420 [Acytostelium subglobosum LB1]